LDLEELMSPESKKISLLAEGRRGVRDACTRMEGPRKASVEDGTEELAVAAHTNNRRIY
jgi:hypothetical protein